MEVFEITDECGPQKYEILTPKITLWYVVFVPWVIWNVNNEKC